MKSINLFTVHSFIPSFGVSMRIGWGNSSRNLPVLTSITQYCYRTNFKNSSIFVVQSTIIIILIFCLFNKIFIVIRHTPRLTSKSNETKLKKKPEKRNVWKKKRRSVKKCIGVCSRQHPDLMLQVIRSPVKCYYGRFVCFVHSNQPLLTVFSKDCSCAIS